MIFILSSGLACFEFENQRSRLFTYRQKQRIRKYHEYIPFSAEVMFKVKKLNKIRVRCFL